jgi:hypothetical protein
VTAKSWTALFGRRLVIKLLLFWGYKIFVLLARWRLGSSDFVPSTFCLIRMPEQVAFIQSMGNEKANSYWEAELPPNYDRVGIENFIRAKYDSSDLSVL